MNKSQKNQISFIYAKFATHTKKRFSTDKLTVHFN